MEPENKVFVIIYRLESNHLRFLCLKPKPEPDRNTDYYVVTGAVEKDESYEKAAIREVLEETGLSADYIINLQNKISYSDHLTHKKYIEHCFATRVKDQTIVLNEEHAGFKWVDAKSFLETVWWEGSNLSDLRQMLNKIVSFENKKF